MEIYSRFHGPEKKFQQHDDYGMYVIFLGGGGTLHIMVAILDLWK